MQYGWDLVLRGIESHAAQIVEIKFLGSRLELSSEWTKDDSEEANTEAVLFQISGRRPAGR